MCPEEKQKQGVGVGREQEQVTCSSRSGSLGLLLGPAMPCYYPRGTSASHSLGPCWGNSLSWEHCLQDMRCHLDVHHLTIAMSPLHMSKGARGIQIRSTHREALGLIVDHFQNSTIKLLLKTVSKVTNRLSFI